MESAEEVEQTARHYDALHHTESQGGQAGSYDASAEQAAVGSGPSGGAALAAPPLGGGAPGAGEAALHDRAAAAHEVAAGKPLASSLLHPGVGAVRALHSSGSSLLLCVVVQASSGVPSLLPFAVPGAVPVP